MFAEPTINDFLNLLRTHCERASDQAAAEIGKIQRRAATTNNLQNSRTVLQYQEEAHKHFEAAIETILGETRRVISMTNLDPRTLRQHAAQELANLLLSINAIGDKPIPARLGMGAYVGEQATKRQQLLEFKIRQFDIGFYQPSAPEVVNLTNNSISIGQMTGAIQQGSNNATQRTEVQQELSVETISTALSSLESALAQSQIDQAKLDELSADISTVRSQLSKPTPSKVILLEAGKSLRNVVEGIGGGLLTPTVSTAASAVWKALGL